jgi:hypothetical protein
VWKQHNFYWGKCPSKKGLTTPLHRVNRVPLLSTLWHNWKRVQLWRDPDIGGRPKRFGYVQTRVNWNNVDDRNIILYSCPDIHVSSLLLRKSMALLPHSKQVLFRTPGMGPFCLDVVCSPRVHMIFLGALWFNSGTHLCSHFNPGWVTTMRI